MGLSWATGQTVAAPTLDQPALQISNASDISLASPSVQQASVTFFANQQTLALQMESLLDQGATSPQLQAWQQQNATLILSQQQLAISLAASTPARPLSYITDVYVPATATTEESSLLATQADLFNRFAELHNQRLQAGTKASGATDESIVFQQQNAQEVAQVQQLAKTVAAQKAQQPMTLPPPLVIPPGSSPQAQAFLTSRDQMLRSFIQAYNRSAALSPADSATAMKQWQQQNAATLQPLPQPALNLSPASSN